MLVQWQRKSAPREIICRLLREKNILYLVDLLLITPLHQVMIDIRYYFIETCYNSDANCIRRTFKEKQSDGN